MLNQKEADNPKHAKIWFKITIIILPTTGFEYQCSS